MIELLKQLTPPILKRIVKYKFREGWHGDYSDWAAAKNETTGYESENIIRRVREAALKVKNGEVAYEQSALTFQKPSVNFPLLAVTQHAALQNNNHLVVLDYGGSLGSSYFQHRHLFQKFSLLRWCIIEQSSFVKVGKEEFEDEKLKFFSSAEDCIETYEPNLILFSSSLQYLSEPYKVLEELFKYEVPYLMIDRTAFIDSKDDRLTIQKVPPAYYDASYPCWFFNKSKFLHFMSSRYNLMGEFKDEMYLQLGMRQLRYEGMWFERKK